MKLVSVVVPCYNEEEVLPMFYEEITKVTDQMKKNFPELEFEFLFVNDGSKDKTLEIFHTLADKDKRVRYISFSRNFGKESGMYAGLQNAKGDYVVVMDADLQHPPSFLPDMYKYVKDGEYDCATTRRVNRKGESKIRSWFAMKFYKIMNKISQTEIVDGAQDFRFMTRQMVDAILDMSEYNRFSKGIFSWVGFNVKYLPYENVERPAGTTSWSFWGLFKYSLEGIMAFSTAPLAISSLLGIVSCIISFILIIITVIKTLVIGEEVDGFPSIICSIFMLSGLQLFCTGILGQYLSKTYLETKRRPIYITKETDELYRKKKQKTENEENSGK
ncbi:MAG: glycosyltransferase family 2 protein [Ruminococcus sp.]|nr:glycosyltransferase family 2 protein [Ruminococcus sp.]